MAEFDDYSKSYHDQINAAISYSGQDVDFYTRVKADYLAALLDQHLDGVGQPKVLDVGCGHGDIHSHLLERKKMDLTGIDVATSVVDEARQLNPGVSYDHYDGVRLPYDDGSFDAAYTICVMHHVPPAQWQAFMDEMRRIVRPGGLVAVFEHNPLNPLTRRLVNNCPIDANAVLLNGRTLTGLFREAGFAKPKRRFIIFTPFSAKFFRWFDRVMGWLPLGAQYFVAGVKES